MIHQTLSQLLKNIESKIVQKEDADESITDAINEATDYVQRLDLKDSINTQLDNYISDYSQAYYFKRRDPTYQSLLVIDDKKKQLYVDISKSRVWLCSYVASYLLGYGIFGIETFGDFAVIVLSSLGVAKIVENIELQTKYFAKKYFHMPGRENVLGSDDYLDKLHHNFLNNLK